jgi:5-formyltetrahydrofolate cyclo-ligase
MTKAALRKEYLAKRREISDSQKMKLDDLLLIRFQQIAFDEINILLSYWPMAHTAEPDTHIYTRYLQHMIPGLQVAYPVTDFDSLTMLPHLTNDETEFEENKFKLTEPVNGQPVDAADIDLIFVPMIICDKKGYRVGYGKAFYDRFLPACDPNAIRVGFSYFEPVDSITDTDEYDVPLHYCITPEMIYEF